MIEPWMLGEDAATWPPVEVERPRVTPDDTAWWKEHDYTRRDE